MSDLPIAQIYNLRDQLSRELDAGNWDEASEIAKRITKLIPKAIDPKNCGGGMPHLDGVFTVGTMRFEGGPKHAARSIRQMNRIINTAKRTLK